MKTVLIASKNKGKLEEYRQLLSRYGYQVLSLFDYPMIEEIEEPFLTFEENALYKARMLYNFIQQPVIADDSGLMVEALNGAPGVHSKRFSSSGTDEANNDLLIEKMKDINNRQAKFVAVIAYLDEFGNSYLFSGETKGIILDKPQGQLGFGYDPLFYIEEKHKSYAELTLDEKNTLSHRAKAFHQFFSFLEGNNEVGRI